MVVAVGAAGAALPLGCEEDGRKISAAGQGQPATQPRPAAQTAPAAETPQPLPDKALVALAKLLPAVARPVNPKAPEKLPPRIRREVEQAEKELAAKKYPAAVALLERAVGFDPKNARTHRLLGKAYLAMRNRGKAETHLDAAVEAAPDDLETQLLLGQLAAAQKQNGKAILRLRTALQCSAAKPDEPLAGEALLTLSLLLDREGYWTAALEGYSLLSDRIGAHGRDLAARPALREWVLRPERLLSRRGGLLLLLRKGDQAAELLERAYRRDRTNGRTAKLLIDALLALKAYPRVEGALLEMAGQPTQRANVPRMLGELAVKTGDRGLPERFWKAFRSKHETDAAVAIGLAKVAEDRGWTEEATSILQSVLALRPTDKDLWRILCRSYAERDKVVELYDVVARGLAADAGALAAIAEGIDRSAGLAKAAGVERRFAEKARQSKSPARPALLYLAGRVATARGKHLLAADLYLRATERKQDFYRAYEALLESYVVQKRPDRVDRLLARVERLARDTHLPAYFRGKIALSRSDAPAAVAALEQALERKADDLATLRLLTDAYALAGRTDEAISTLRKALKAHPDNAELTRRLFDIYVSRRRFREAASLATELLKRDRDSIPARLMMAELALASNRRAQALILLSQLVREAPDSADVQLLSIRTMLGSPPALISKKAFDDAAERLRRILRAEPDSRRARQALADLLAAVGKTKEAAAARGELFEEDPADTSLARQYVAALARAKQYQTALRAVDRFLEEAPDDSWGRVTKLSILAKLQRARDARLLGSRWIRETKDQDVVKRYREQLLAVLEAGDEYEEALKFVEEWTAEKPSEARLRRLSYSRLRLLALAGRYDEANRIADQLVQIDPIIEGGSLIVAAAVQAKDYDRMPGLVDRWVDVGRRFLADLTAVREAVERMAEKAAATDAKYDEAIKKLPETLRSGISDAVAAKQHARALASLDRRIGVARAGLDSIRSAKVIVFGEAKKLPLARKEAGAWMKESPHALAPRRALVGLLSEAEAHAEADQLVTRWLGELTPTTTPARKPEADETARWLRETSVRLKISLQQNAEALKLAETYLKAEPNSPDMLSLKSACLTELGRDAEALAAMEAAYAVKPDDESLNNNLGYMYADRGVQLSKAENMLKVAMEARPGEVAFADSMAWIFYKQVRFRDAGRVFQRLLTSGAPDVEHCVILDHAGDVYWRLGWRDRAAGFWRRALALAEKIKRPSREERALLAAVPEKIKAARSGTEPKVAPVSPAAPQETQKATGDQGS